MADLTAIPSDSTTDPERLRRLLALGGGMSVQPNRPTLPSTEEINARAAAMPSPSVDRLTPIAGSSLPASNATTLQPISSKSAPLSSPGVPIGSSGYYQNKIQKIQDEQDNANQHSGFLGGLKHVGATIGNKLLDITGINTIPGTEANRNARSAWDQEQLDKAQTRESADAARKATEAYQTGELENRNRTTALAEKREKFEEGKPGTPEQESIKDLQGQVNPKTGKNYTAEEAEVKRAQDIQDTKPDKADQQPKTVTMLDKLGGKPFEYQYDPKGNYKGDQGYGQWKKVGPAQPNAAAVGLIGTLTPLLGQNGEIQGTMNTKTGEIKPIGPNAVTAGGATTGTGARLSNTERNQFNTQYVKPATDVETNYRKAQAAMEAYNNNPQTGAAGMVELSQHIATTLGSVKGVSVGEHMIHEHENAIGLSEKAARYLDYLSTGQPLSAAQMRDFNQLIQETRDITWSVAAKEAARRHLPIDFLPANVQISMKDGSGKVRHVPGDRVQGYLDKGAEMAD